MNNNNICITCTNGVYDFDHKWFDIFELCDGDYEELKEKFEMPEDSYLIITDCENNIGKLFLGCRDKAIIDEISDKIGHIEYVGINVEYIKLADELLNEVSYEDFDDLEFIAHSWDELIDEIIEHWDIPEDAKTYIDRNAIKEDEETKRIIVTTSYGLYEVV